MFSSMEITSKRFNELSNYGLYEILRIRAQVFVVEQNCAYQDLMISIRMLCISSAGSMGMWSHTCAHTWKKAASTWAGS